MDVSTGSFWSTSNWKWAVPSLTMLYDPYMFSPASAIEGYTTNDQLTCVPYFQTYVGYNFTTLGNNVLGSNVPSGIDTQVLPAASYYGWWSMIGSYSGSYSSSTIEIRPLWGMDYHTFSVSYTSVSYTH